MSRNVILITVAGLLWGVAGTAPAQQNLLGRVPTAVVDTVNGTGSLIVIPTVSALNRTPLMNVPDIAATPRVLVGAALNLPTAAPGLSGKLALPDKTAKDSGSPRSAKEETTLAANAHRKELHRVPTCN